MNNPVRFVSLGPGDSELITIKALHALQQAEIIYCPATTTNESRAVDLITKLNIKGIIRPFILPMSKDRTKTKLVYQEIISELTEEHREGKKLAVAVEGDTGIYASIHYILDELKNKQILTEQLCGIPSFIAAGATAQLHIISQDERLVVIPGNITIDELDHYLRNKHVPAIMKLSRCTNMIHKYIIQHPEYTYHYFENIATDKEYYSSDQKELIGKDYPYFSLMLIISQQWREESNIEQG